jgi:Flp pilus assembly protein TadG
VQHRLGRPTPRDDRGVSSIEFAFIAPMLLLLVWFVIQAALYFYGRSVALQAAREAVSQYRLAQTQQQYNAVHDRVAANTTDYAAHVGSGALNDVNVTPDYTGERVTVTVTGTTISLVPGLTLKVTETASGTVEKFGNSG